MKLSQGKADATYRIVSTSAEGKALARLNSLGLVNGEDVFVLSSSYAGLIVNIKGSRLAICKSMADKLEVEAVGDRRRQCASRQEQMCSQPDETGVRHDG